VDIIFKGAWTTNVDADALVPPAEQGSGRQP